MKRRNGGQSTVLRADGAHRSVDECGPRGGREPGEHERPSGNRGGPDHQRRDCRRWSDRGRRGERRRGPAARLVRRKHPRVRRRGRRRRPPADGSGRSGTAAALRMRRRARLASNLAATVVEPHPSDLVERHIEHHESPRPTSSTASMPPSRNPPARPGVERGTTPEIPRATIIPSKASTIDSRLSIPLGFSSLAITRSHLSRGGVGRDRGDRQPRSSRSRGEPRSVESAGVLLKRGSEAR